MEIDENMPYIKLNTSKIVSNSLSRQFNKNIFSKCSSKYGFEQTLNLVEKSIFLLYNSSSLILKSNPSIEIYHLTGWIPEILTFEENENKENLWQKLITNFTEGNILLCLGTGSIKDPVIANSGFSLFEKIISRSTSKYKIYLTVINRFNPRPLLHCFRSYRIK
jgi:hypothetical protein